jgi:hypothetical protein
MIIFKDGYKAFAMMAGALLLWGAVCFLGVQAFFKDDVTVESNGMQKEPVIDSIRYHKKISYANTPTVETIYTVASCQCPNGAACCHGIHGETIGCSEDCESSVNVCRCSEVKK